MLFDFVVARSKWLVIIIFFGGFFCVKSRGVYAASVKKTKNKKTYEDHGVYRKLCKCGSTVVRAEVLKPKLFNPHIVYKGARCFFLIYRCCGYQCKRVIDKCRIACESFDNQTINNKALEHVKENGFTWEKQDGNIVLVKRER